MRAVSNAGPIIHLSWIGYLNLLSQLFDEILVPIAVRDEILRPAPEVPGVPEIHAAFQAGWLAVRAVTDLTRAEQLRADLDPGEAEAIALAEELGADLLLLDERRARAVAVSRRIPIAGTLGILRKARERGLVQMVSPLIDELRLRGFRISAELVEELRREEA
ncbi:MAG: DUF3368 domain-containing protein [Actinobacteria bacterium]|nr:DUF3368 domain-containing protein [Actinomycetota bacterium]